MCIFVMVVRFEVPERSRPYPPPHNSHSHRSLSFLMPKARGTTLNSRSCVACVCFPPLLSFFLSLAFSASFPHSPRANLSVVIHVGHDSPSPPLVFQAVSALPLSASGLSNEGNSAICVWCQDAGDGALGSLTVPLL